MNKNLSYDVILATYNGEKYVSEQIESILSQTIPPKHIYIRDDASTDSTLEVLNAYNYRDDITIIAGIDNVGYIKNFEALISYAKSDVVFFSDQDDVWLPNKAALILDVFEVHQNAKTVFSNAFVSNQLLDNVGDLWGLFGFSKEQNGLHRLLENNYVTGATMAVRRNFLNKNTPFPVNIPHDYYIAFISAINDGLYACDIKTMKYRQHSGNVIGIEFRKNNLYSRITRAMSLHWILRKRKTYIEAKAILDLLELKTMENQNKADVQSNELFNYIRIMNYVYGGSVYNISQDDNSPMSYYSCYSFFELLSIYVKRASLKSILFDMYVYVYFRVRHVTFNAIN